MLLLMLLLLFLLLLLLFVIPGGAISLRVWETVVVETRCCAMAVFVIVGCFCLIVVAGVVSSVGCCYRMDGVQRRRFPKSLYE